MKASLKALPLIALLAVALPPDAGAESPEEKGLASAREMDRRGSGIPGAVQLDSAWELLSGALPARSRHAGQHGAVSLSADRLTARFRTCALFVVSVPSGTLF